MFNILIATAIISTLYSFYCDWMYTRIVKKENKEDRDYDTMNKLDKQCDICMGIALVVLVTVAVFA